MADKGKVLLTTSSRDGLPQDRHVLLARHDVNSISPLFDVKDTPVRLVAFGLSGKADTQQKESMVIVHRVWYPDNQLDLTDCGELVSGQPFEMPLRYAGGIVTLMYSQPEIVIDMVGTYRVEFLPNDNLEERDMLHVIKLNEPLMRVNDTARIGFMS